MSERTGIEWTDHTFNVAWGCQKVSPGCAHCYADTLTKRHGYGKLWGPPATSDRRVFGPKHWNEPLRWEKKAARAGERRRVFCSSMCDLFEDHPTIDAEREKLWPLIRETPHLDWQLLTKRPERILANLPPDWGAAGYHNVWLGTSIESQEYLDRARVLMEVPAAAVRFISAEPLIGPIAFDFDDIGIRAWDGRMLDWIIVGGESGPGARPMSLHWVRSIRDECLEHEVALFVKQLGGHPNKRGGADAELDGRRWLEMPGDAARLRL